MTIYTIAYNGYGIFLEEWLKNAKKAKPDAIIIVLGPNHGANVDKLKGCTILYSDSLLMGTLRNVAIKEIRTEFMLYFSADDILYPNVLLEIDYSLDACALKYIDTETNEEREGAVYRITDIPNWRTTTVPGYIAVKRVFKGQIMYYEDIEIPNYPYLFKLVSMGFKIGKTANVCAKYVRRENSHGGIAKQTGRFNEYAKYIDERALFYYNNVKGSIVNIDYNDAVLGRKLNAGDILEEQYGVLLTPERKKYLISIGFVKPKEERK